MADTINNNINIGGTGAGFSISDPSTLALLIDVLQKMGVEKSKLVDLVSGMNKIPAGEDVSGMIKVIQDENNRRFESLEATIQKLIEKNGEQSELGNQLEELRKSIKTVKTNGTKQGNEIKSILKRLGLLETAIEDMKNNPVVTPTESGNPTGAVNDENPADKEDPKVGDGKDTGDTADDKDKEEPSNDKDEEDPTDDKEDPTGSSGGHAPTGPITTGGDNLLDNPEDVKKKFMRAKFLDKSRKETVILSEPKRPWYKRLSLFSVNHPVLTTVIGAGIGLGLTAASCGCRRQRRP